MCFLSAYANGLTSKHNQGTALINCSAKHGVDLASWSAIFEVMQDALVTVANLTRCIIEQVETTVAKYIFISIL